MTEKTNNNKFLNFVKTIQDYWFLITLLFSATAALFYFFYFDVNPLEKQYENKIQTLHVDLHNNIALSYLQQGYYEKAKREYDQALDYKSYNKDALNGKLLSDLFISLKSIEHNPTLADKTKEEVIKLEIDKGNELHLIREKYFADLVMKKGELTEAVALYDRILKEDSSYVDLLNTYGWLNYELPIPDYNKMASLFSKMIVTDETDYRGYHGYGYAMYIKALYEKDETLRGDYLYEAANQCINAYNLIFTRYNVVLDLGEIVRSINPDMAVSFHQRAKQLLEDPVIMNLEENSPTLGYKLLTFENGGYIMMSTFEQKKAVLFYELALDYLADYRINYEITSLIEHDEMFELAKEFDKNGDIKLIYDDQRAVLDFLLPEE